MPFAGRCTGCPEGFTLRAFQFGVPVAEFGLTPSKPEFAGMEDLPLADAEGIGGGGGGVVGFLCWKVDIAGVKAACGFAAESAAFAGGNEVMPGAGVALAP